MRWPRLAGEKSSSCSSGGATGEEDIVESNRCRVLWAVAGVAAGMVLVLLFARGVAWMR